MCVRTKSSYGCGCTYKSTNECRSSRCNGLERFHCMRDGDCRSCKSGGEAITRGREGKGRYAQEISRRSPPVDIPSSTGPRIDVSGGASPWASSGRRTDEWHSPTRVKADDAWQKEHDRRVQDLQSRAEQLSVSEPPSPLQVVRRRSPSPKAEDFSDHYFSQDEDDCRHKALVPRTLFGEMKGIRETQYSRRRPSYSGDRYESNDSIDSLPKLRAASKPQSYEIRDPCDSGYGSYDSYDSHKSHRRPHTARTEPYLYSTPSHRQFHEVPVPAAPYGYPAGTYGVEVHPSAKYLSRW